MPWSKLPRGAVRTDSSKDQRSCHDCSNIRKENMTLSNLKLPVESRSKVSAGGGRSSWAASGRPGELQLGVAYDLGIPSMPRKEVQDEIQHVYKRCWA